MAFRFQQYNPHTGKFDRSPGNICSRNGPSSRKGPSSNKPQFNIQVLPISAVGDDDKSMLCPGSPTTTEANSDQGSETVGSRAIAENRQTEPPFARDSEVLCKDVEKAASGPASNTPDSVVGELSDAVESPHDTHDSSIRSTEGTPDAESHSPNDEGLKHFKSFPSLTAFSRIAWNSGALKRLMDHNPETALAGKGDTFPPDQWKVRGIIGEEVMGGVRYYLVDWAPTLEPASNVSKDLLEAWKNQKARMQANTRKTTNRSKVVNRRGGMRRG
ncbi:hypothetical protein F5144DRAFT_601997 [Chaetomium tenue]|uniref:Uncharacterized protein n=1 Tax=Chaetomium tenue TaxID=1854479 RepID=A0ACB7PEX1_9PEZI|nr:hypothetical protein F5144DRAFT_601997 [Chaetomium globosum]